MKIVGEELASDIMKQRQMKELLPMAMLSYKRRTENPEQFHETKPKNIKILEALLFHHLTEIKKSIREKKEGKEERKEEEGEEEGKEEGKRKRKDVKDETTKSPHEKSGLRYILNRKASNWYKGSSNLVLA